MTLLPTQEELMAPPKKDDAVIEEKPKTVKTEKNIDKKVSVNVPKAKKEEKVEISEPGTPSDLGKSLDYKVFGCGGFGRSIVDGFAHQLIDQEFFVLDTTEYIPSRDNIVSLAIPGLDGSAKHRASNYNTIKKFLANTELPEFDEMNIVICSCSGGSGSVIAPLLIKEIVRQGKQAILISVVDRSSEIDARNSVNSLLSFESMIGEAYTPLVLFNNALGRANVDKGVYTTLNVLDVVMSQRFNKLDTSDRLMFFAPSRGSANIIHGMKLMGVSTDKDGAWFTDRGFVNPPADTPVLDSILLISNETTDVKPKARCNLQYNGYHQEDYVVALSCGAPIPRDLIKEYNDEILLFKNVMSAQDSNDLQVDKDVDGTKTQDGMIL